jgi:hypothetical protein
MADENRFALCRIHALEDEYSLTFSDFDPTAAVFEEMGQEGGGYGWHGVVDALVRMQAPELAPKLE